LGEWFDWKKEKLKCSCRKEEGGKGRGKEGNNIKGESTNTA